MEGKSSMLKKFCATIVMTDCRMDNNPYGFYNDQAGFCTVGIGHFVAKKSCADIDKLPPSSPIKQSKDKVGWVKAKVDADKLKRQDLVRYVNLVNNNVKVKLTQEQFDALVSLAFNIESAIDAGTSTLIRILTQENVTLLQSHLILELIIKLPIQIQRKKIIVIGS